MELSDKEIRAQICDVCHKMWQLGWVASNDGNVSVKLSDGTFLATPTGVSKSMVTPEMIVHIDKAGEIIEVVGGYRPSSEMRMHFRCYEEREDVGAVWHIRIMGLRIVLRTVLLTMVFRSRMIMMNRRCFICGIS